MIKVLVVGQTPPPQSGQAIMIQRFVNCKLADVQLIHVRMGFSSNENEVGRVRLAKILHMFAIVARIIYHRFADGVRILYYPPAGPDRIPVCRDCFILISTRWLFEKTIFHFRAGGISELYDRLPRWQRWLFRKAYFHADTAIRLSALNPEDGKKLQAKRHYVIPNGLDDPFPGLVVSQLDIDKKNSNYLHILFVGILRESKGVMVLIEACAKLTARNVRFRLEIMGQWRSKEFSVRVQKRIRELNLESHIVFLGVRSGSEKYVAYRRADVLCFPTYYNCETFGNVLIEAMACGLPVVSTRWRGIPSIVDDGETGFLVEPRDADALADRLSLLADNGDLREQMGREGRAKFEREYVYPIHAGRMRRALLETAGVHVDTASDADDLYVQHSVWIEPADCGSESYEGAASVRS
jgi:glycosyltransferase involved in cell wall biosynthesis